jgi:CubicO group peptidase (beta-lactamase class C family)
MAKTFASMLVGIAIEKGQINRVGDSITAYLPELARRDARFNRITIRDLLRMSSGLRYVEDAAPYDDRRTYMDPDLRRAGLEGTVIVEEPGKHWLYNNYNPMLIGMVLERVSGRSVTDLLQSGIWEPLGMEYGGSWSLDSRASGFEKMECCINARAIDFAKFGGMLLHHGAWNGRQVVSPQWITDASQPWPTPAGYFGDEGYMGRGGHYYGYFIWGDNRAGGESDFHAVGNKGQYIYVSPQKHVVIVRTGIQYGIPSAQWVRVLRELADRL